MPNPSELERMEQESAGVPSDSAWQPNDEKLSPPVGVLTANQPKDDGLSPPVGVIVPTSSASTSPPVLQPKLDLRDRIARWIAFHLLPARVVKWAVVRWSVANGR